MIVRKGNLLWECNSTDAKPTVSMGAGDDQFLKELDTGDTYERQAGQWINIGVGLSFIRATKSGRITTDGTGKYHVSFATPFINTSYTVALSCDDSGTTQPAIALFSNLATTGFDIQTRYSRTGNVRPTTVVSWLATMDFNP